MKANPDFDPKLAAKKLLREGRSGALATLMAGSGDPYCSLVNVATAADGAPLLLISTLAIHTKNLLDDPRCSLMIDERKEGDPLEGGRVMLLGTAVWPNNKKPVPLPSVRSSTTESMFSMRAGEFVSMSTRRFSMPNCCKCL